MRWAVAAPSICQPVVNDPSALIEEAAKIDAENRKTGLSEGLRCESRRLAETGGARKKTYYDPRHRFATEVNPWRNGNNGAQCVDNRMKCALPK
jgi:hypothetical protein